MKGSDPAIKAKALERYAEGLPPAAIADRLGVRVETVRKWARAAGLPRQPRTLYPPELYAQLYNRDRLSIRQIAERLSVSVPTVCGGLKAAGVEMRPRGCGRVDGAP